MALQDQMGQYGVSLYKNDENRVFAHERGGFGSTGGIREITDPQNLAQQHGININSLPTYNSYDDLEKAGFNNYQTGKANVDTAGFGNLLNQYAQNQQSLTPARPPAVQNSIGDPNYAWGGKYNVLSGGTDPNAIRPPTGNVGDGGVSTQNIPTSYGPRPTTGNPALDAVYARRTDLQQLYNSDGSAKNPNDPRTGANIATLNDWVNVYGTTEEPSLGGSVMSNPISTGGQVSGQPNNQVQATPINAEDTTPARPPGPSVAAQNGGGAMAALGAAPNTTASANYAEARQRQHDLANLTPEELQTQQARDALMASKEAGINQIMFDNTVPYQEKTGTAAGIEAQASTKIQNLNQKLASLMANRQAQYAQASQELGQFGGQEVPIGGSVVARDAQGNYTTVAQGQSYAGKQNYASALKASVTYADAGIHPETDTPEQVAAKLNNSASWRASHQNFRVGVDGNGNLYEVNTKTGQFGNGSAFSDVPIPSNDQSNSQSGSGINFTLASDGRTVLANGKPVDLNEFRQLTNQTGSNTDFSMVKGGIAQHRTAQRALDNGGSPAPSGVDYATQNPIAHQYFLSGDDGVFGRMSLTTRQLTIKAAQNEAKDLGISNWSAAKVKALNAADAKNYAQQVEYLTTTSRALKTAESGASLTQNLFKNKGINPYDSTFANTTINDLTAKFGDSGDIRAYKAAMYEIGNEYAQVFARGGSRNERGNEEAQGLVNGNVKLADIQKTLDTLQEIGKNAISNYKNTVTDIIGGYGPKADNGQSTGAGNSNGSFGNPLNLDLPGLK